MSFIEMSIFVVALASPPERPCAGPLTREGVVACAIVASPRIRADRERIAAARGDVQTARIALPSNPVVALNLGYRWNDGGERGLNVAGTVSQKIEVGGQRRERKHASAAMVEVRELQAEMTERDVVADALWAYYDVLAARKELVVIERGHATAERLREVTQGRASAQLAAPLEVDLAAAEAAGLREQVALAQGRVRIAEVRLASALGHDPARPIAGVHGRLDPLPTPAGLDEATAAALRRPESSMRRAERSAREGELELLRKDRVPSPSLSFFAQSDGFDERVVGGGLSFPVPLPFPVGRTHRGEIEAKGAEIREAEERLDAEQRALTLEAAVAYHEFRASSDAASAYPDHDEDGVQRGLEDLSAAIEGGRLPVRDALLMQRALIGRLLRAVEARHRLCRASVALALAAGFPFGGGER